MQTEPSETRSRAMTISNALSHLHRESQGRGPESVRTVVAHDHVICFLEGILTPAERTLVEAGETDAVMQSRRAYQRAMQPRFEEVVQSVTGRAVRAFLSQVTLDPDIAVEVFVLERDGSDPAPEGLA